MKHNKTLRTASLLFIAVLLISPIANASDPEIAASADISAINVDFEAGKITVSKDDSTISVDIEAGSSASGNISFLAYKNGAEDANIECIEQFTAGDGHFSAIVPTKTKLENGDVLRIIMGGLSEPVDLEIVLSTVIGISTNDKTSFRDKVEYTIKADNMQAVNLVALTMVVEGDPMDVAAAKIQGLNGFDVFQPFEWTDLGNNNWKSNVILGTYAGVTKSGSMDIGRLEFDAVRLGNAKVSISEVKVFGIDTVDGKPVSNERFSSIHPASAATEIFSVYDINDDGIVDYIDLSLAFYYYRAEAGDANWDYAKVADVNEDGVVDMLDFVGIYANFIE